MALTTQHVADSLAGLLRDGLDYYRFAAHHTPDPSVHEAFCYAADSRAPLLRERAAGPAIADADCDQPAGASDPDLGYTGLRAQFDPNAPHCQGVALHERECAVLAHLEALFRKHQSPRVRELMKMYYPQLKRVEEMMMRLSKRPAVA